MSLSTTSRDVKNHIVSFFSLLQFTLPNCVSQSPQLATLTKVNKEFREICGKTLTLLKHFECSTLTNHYGSTPLINALAIGANKGTPNHVLYTRSIDCDIVRMIRHGFQNVECNHHFFQRRTHITPLVMACYNPCIPFKIIELLLKNSERPNGFYNVDGKPTTLLLDLEDLVKDDKRKKFLKELLIQHGAV